MRTLKWIGPMVVLVAILAGCGPNTDFQQPPILPAAGQDELNVSFVGDGTLVTFTVSGDRSVEFSDSDDKWYYDVPEDKPEYALVEMTGDRIFYVHVHLHQSKKPQN